MKLKHWIKIIIFAVISILLIVLASSVLCVANEKDTVGIYGFYKEPEDSVSVILIGPSTMYTSFYSPLAYEKYGFTSYSLATSSMTSAAYKSAKASSVFVSQFLWVKLRSTAITLSFTSTNTLHSIGLSFLN